jgi:hypothetical protein
MLVKLFELRDRATFIPIICFECSLEGRTKEETFLLRRAGYSNDFRCILLTRLDGGNKSCYDPYDWNDRTFQQSHKYIEEQWDKLISGEVIDVEYILGESKTKKISERLQ